jgi:6-pyruvoyltetrahydropterin/6-carboxytetrahydropterin synthase
MNYTVEVRDHFNSAHFLPDHPGKCSNPHGHRWEVEIRVDIQMPQPGAQDTEWGSMFVDFGDLKQIITSFDHKNLNDGFQYPTAEVIATAMWNDVYEVVGKARSRSSGMRGSWDCHWIQVQVWEGPDSSITLGGEI